MMPALDPPEPQHMSQMIALRAWLFLIPQQFSLRVPDLQAVPVDYVMIRTQGFGGFERRFEGLKDPHGMTTMSRDAKRSV
jgi:hypothetical protein